MKKIIALSAAALLAVGAVSCQSGGSAPVAEGGARIVYVRLDSLVNLYDYHKEMSKEFEAAAAKAEAELARIATEGTVTPEGLPQLDFRPKDHLVFDYGPNLPGHANGLVIKGVDGQGDVLTEVTPADHVEPGGFLDPLVVLLVGPVHRHRE